MADFRDLHDLAKDAVADDVGATMTSSRNPDLTARPLSGDSDNAKPAL
jgi:hypothetical protein